MNPKEKDEFSGEGGGAGGADRNLIESPILDQSYGWSTEKREG